MLYDDVLNKHREVIYKKRKEFLVLENWKLKIENWTQSDEDKKVLAQKEQELGENFGQVAKAVALRTLDMLWLNHLEEMEALRDSVRLRAYGQQDPLVEYKTEGHRMFKKLLDMIEANIAQTILRVSLKPQSEGFTKSHNSVGFRKSANQSVGRNEPCWCGSGKKLKKCHGA